jgi:transcriptional regulator with XRE-family HTH domain
LPDYLHFRQLHPGTDVWLAIGLHPRSALALVNAGIRSREDLEKWSREEVLRLLGIGKSTLAKIEHSLGIKLRSRIEVWLENGVPANTAYALVRAGFNSPDDVATLTQEQFLQIQGMGEKVLAHCERVLGHPLPSPRAYWLERGLPPRTALKLAVAGISNLAQLGNITDLRRIGLDTAEVHACKGLLAE